MRVCRNCQLSKNDTEFHLDKRTNWYWLECKVCTLAGRKARKAANRALGLCFCGEKPVPEHLTCEVHQKDGRARYHKLKEKNEKWFDGRRIRSRLTGRLRRGIKNPEIFPSLLQLQESRCGICRRDDLKLVADHDHVTGLMRGALCSACNSGIGHLKDSVDILQAAIAYLTDSPANRLAQSSTLIKIPKIEEALTHPFT